MKYVSNAFSAKMLNQKNNPAFDIQISSLKEIQKEKDELISAIGHQSVANHLNMEKNRINIQLEQGDIIYLAQPKMDDERNVEYNYWKIIVRER